MVHHHADMIVIGRRDSARAMPVAGTGFPLGTKTMSASCQALGVLVAVMAAWGKAAMGSQASSSSCAISVPLQVSRLAA